ncbi:MAG: hypothetical protein SFU56_08155 [Capsulimonadales bacterium]|nr:hypothetical protein [Capsulimonadales bacterium]
MKEILNDRQYKGLGLLLHMALGHIPTLIQDGKLTQAIELAEAVRVLPLWMNNPNAFALGWDDPMINLGAYEASYPDDEIGIVNIFRRIRDNPTTC